MRISICSEDAGKPVQEPLKGEVADMSAGAVRGRFTFERPGEPVDYVVKGVGTISGERDSDISGYKRMVLQPRSEGACAKDWGPWRPLG